jgi:DNA helicase HerA-like ATPase
MKSILLGKGCSLNLETMARTRMLVQANSGGGKSYLIRKLLEMSYGQVQHIVLDIEGEFSSLREKYDYLLVGKGGGAYNNPRGRLKTLGLIEYGAGTVVARDILFFK